jgi:hypothetical protein
MEPSKYKERNRTRPVDNSKITSPHLSAKASMDKIGLEKEKKNDHPHKGFVFNAVA